MSGPESLRNTQDLSVAMKSLLKLVNQIQFGRIDRLFVFNGEPVLNPKPRIIREVKFRGASAQPSITPEKEFELKTQARELVEFISRIKAGVISRIEIQHGLPFRMHIEEGDSA